MTIRITTCKELAEDKTAIQNMMQCYANIDQGANPIAVMFPWFPSTSRRAKEKGTMGLYTLLTRFVDQRRSSPVPSTEPIDVLLGQGLSTDSIVGVKLIFDFTTILLF
jgi:sterol 14-demethylase